tara:strand:+ start:122 stop:322 length:201 start_codon:yes stop_codon:yes gene_type:complete
MPKKTKTEKALNGNTATYRQPLQFKIEEEIKKDKLKPVEIFDNFKKEKTNKRTLKKKKVNKSKTGY